MDLDDAMLSLIATLVEMVELLIRLHPGWSRDELACQLVIDVAIPLPFARYMVDLTIDNFVGGHC